MISKELAKFTITTNYDDIPKKVIEKAKMSFLDYLAVTLRGSLSPSGIKAYKLHMTTFGTIHDDYIKFSTVIGHNKANYVIAGLINGISAHALDFDDGHSIAQIHPGAVIFSTALALSESHMKTGKEFLEASIIGYEVAIALSKMINPSHRNKGFHTTGTIGTIASAVVAAKILGLNEEEIMNAIGLATTQAAGLLISDHEGTMAKHLHAGNAVESGIMAALLAQQGMTGPKNVFEGNQGFFTTHINKVNGKLELGKYHILDVYIKEYPVCAHLHPTINATKNILKEINSVIIPQNISKITIETYKIASEHNNVDINSIEGLKQSLPISLAITVLKGNITLDYIDEYFDNIKFKSEVDNLVSKIELNYNSKLDEKIRQSKVKINYNNEKYTSIEDNQNKKPEFEDVLKKFNTLNPDMADKDINMINNIESNQIRIFMNLFYKYP